ncbi:MAG: hypothetical protein HY015_06985 [Bacteroidetes bacterium]|nr:hypothetical protein [Bacteroidota bacterium]MBI3482709.1 hypothetical protein [Bacteroidota bacterium]
MKNLKSFIFILALVACSSDQVQKDLLNYINTELPKVSALEREAIAAYESISGDNYTSDSIMYYTIKQTVLPKYEEFSTKLTAIHPATEEINTMHAEYVKAAGDQMEAFKLICLAIEKQDAEVIRQANNDLDQARNLIALWKKDLDEKCKKHGITFEKESDKK